MPTSPDLRRWASVSASLVMALLTPSSACSQTPAVHPLDDARLREYSGVYQWGADAFVYLQVFDETTDSDQLVAFDETGEVRTLYSTERDGFFAGPGYADRSAVESHVEFARDNAGNVVSLAWRRGDSPPRVARRAKTETREDVKFSNGNVELAGALIRPTTGGKYPAIILVHGSGAADRENNLHFARFLIRHGMAVLGFDKRGVGGSSGDWNHASFADLAGDVVAAFEYLKTRSDIDSGQIGLLGLSQAGWIMPLAAVQAKDIAFLISISGAGVTAAETTVDQARNEMISSGMRPEAVTRVAEIMKLQYRFAETGQGWDEYVEARRTLAARMGRPPGTFPESPDDPYWQSIRRLYFYDPAPTLRQLQTPTLALFGELDNNILPDKNKAAWESALSAGGNPDYTLRILSKANHSLFQSKVGNNAETPSLQRIVPEYFEIVKDWLAQRISSFPAQR